MPDETLIGDETIDCHECDESVRGEMQCPDCRRCHVCCRCGGGEG